MKEIHINELKVFREECLPLIDKYLFRGVTNTDYELIPKIGRYFKQYSIYGDEAKKIEYELFKLFSLKAVEFQNIPEKGFYILALAQHHGLATRLLDWTTNPFVALYFAVEKIDNNDSVVYACDKHVNIQTKITIIEDGEEIEKAEVGEEIIEHPRYDHNFFFLPPSFSQRISVQSAVLQAFPDPIIPYSDSKMIKFIIKGKKTQKKIKETLNLYGFNRYKLFPGLDSLCEFLNEKKKIRNINDATNR